MIRPLDLDNLERLTEGATEEEVGSLYNARMCLADLTRWEKQIPFGPNLTAYKKLCADAIRNRSLPESRS